MRKHRFLPLGLLFLFLISCSNLKEIERGAVNSLSNRTIVVTLKEPKDDVLDDLNSEKAERYEANIQHYNDALRTVFEDDWDFGRGVKFAKTSDLGEYTNKRKYAILTSTAYVKEGRRENIGYWIFMLQRSDNLTKVSDENDFDEVDYHLSFPLVKTVGEKDDEEDFIPFTFDPFQEDYGISHYPGIKNTINGNFIGYSKSDIVLMARLMENHLKAIDDEFEGDFKDYMEREYAKNCNKLKNEKIVVNPGRETSFYESEASLMLSSKSEIQEMYEKQKSKGNYDNHPYEVKVMRSAAINKKVMSKSTDYNYFMWYPYSFAKKARVVLNSKGEIMGIGRYSSFTGRVKGDLRNVKKCP